MSTIFCVLCTKFAYMIYQTVLVLNSLVMEMFAPDVSGFLSVTPPDLTRFIAVQQIQGQTGSDVSLQLVFIILMINNISAFIFIVSAFC